MLVRVLLRAERTGKWPSMVGIVVIVLIPKDDGTFRPIGLLPFASKIWMKARRDIGLEWERQQARPYLYAGERKGADIAAWKQAARAELASTTETPAGYAQALLDLVKAFERVPTRYWPEKRKHWDTRSGCSACRLPRTNSLVWYASAPLYPSK